MWKQGLQCAARALVLGGLCLGAPEMALADEPAEAGSDRGEKSPSIEEITITGSRIARTNLEGLGPVTVLSSEDIEVSGVQTVDELLRELPSVGFQSANQNSNNGGSGLRNVELRNLQASRTLVLVNGRRFVSTGSGTGEAVDINNVPTALIERIDVLRDGVSTIYGSDAVAGVINFVLKDDFEGFQMEAVGGISDEGDGEEAGLNMLWGKNWARSNLTLSGAFFSREEVLQRDRNRARFPLTAASFINNNPANGYIETVGSSFVPEGRVDINRKQGGSRFFRPDGSGASFSEYDRARRGDAYNFAENSYLVPEQVRYVTNASYRYELTDAVELFAEAEYAKRNSQQELAPVPAGFTSTRGQPDGFTFPIYRDPSRNNPNLPQDFVDTTFAELNDPNATQTDVTLNRRFLETGNRITTQDSQTQRFAAGFRGELEGPIGPLSWEVFGNYGRNMTTEKVDNQINLTRAIASAQPEVCAQTPDCVVGNFFGRESLFETPGAIDYLRYESRDRLGFHLKEVGTSIAGGVLTLPAGELKLAAGAEYRQEDGFVSPDSLTVSGDASGNGLDPTRGSFITRSAFWESTVPIVANVPLVEELSLELSGRYTDYSSFGGKYLSRYGFSYAPVGDLRLRGVFATAFRAPGISDLFGGAADSFPQVSDPCDGYQDPESKKSANVKANCAAQLQGRPFRQGAAQIRANIGGNPELKEEEATTYNFGLVYQPSFIPDLAVALDYYSVEIHDPIVNRNSQRVVDNCYDVDGVPLSAPDCANVERNEAGTITRINTPQENVGKIETAGLDFDMNYAFELPLLGATRANVDATYVFDYVITDDAGKEKQNGFIAQNSGSIPNFKARFGTRFQPTDDLSWSLTARYIGGATDRTRHEQRLPFDGVSGIWYLDSSARYSLNENYDVTFGVRNLADKRPPLFVDGASNTNLATYDVLGRYIFARFTAAF